MDRDRLSDLLGDAFNGCFIGLDFAFRF